ncbi:hypothetical protein DFQ01_11593 [Paenibacillus cellulosilyticus]|uniref:DUF4375 domain-containing protein n=1 Tax=Paenibacillus cellulosilyticus TaxID=375489 RepID=A0A2V2YQQ8_9BACL|nr:hypothetical protein [Paenibacillus cellulosilyticus]PWV99377.1 hypothetical protein DFQ01_11593 [Paenibacillus cellulosilyticus]QKS45141.1 hypothetical protein HUB94_12460 [Paenibacillus cellulosilyticus]
MNLIEMKQAEFDSMSDERLGWSCVEPFLMSIRAKDTATKTKVIRSLNPSQQALCMFKVFYGHARGSAHELYAWVAYLLHTPGYWQGVTKGLSFFGDDRMLQLLEDMRQFIVERKQGAGDSTEFHPLHNIEHDNELTNRVVHFYARFQSLEHDSLKQISSFIRANPQDFVKIEG